MNYIIYKTIHVETGKFYIGMHQTKELSTDNYLGSGLWIKRSIAKYGINAFIREIISKHNSYDEMCLAEKNIITDELLANSQCMNLTHGGKGGWKKINSGPEAFERRSKGGKIGGLHPNARKNLKPSSKEDAQKAVATKKQKYGNDFFKNISLNTKRSNETKTKLSNAIKNRKHINKDGKMKQVKSYELEKFLLDGWKLGGLQRRKNNGSLA